MGDKEAIEKFREVLQKFLDGCEGSDADFNNDDERPDS